LFADAAIDRARSGRPEFETWQHLSKRLRNQSAMRNKLVHRRVVEFPLAPAGRRVALCPWVFPKQWNKARPRSGDLCLMDVAKTRLEFSSLADALENFRERLCGRQEPHPQSPGQSGNPPTFLQLMRQIHEELGHPQLSSRERRAATSAANAAASCQPLPE
jgi:hypothetical protein